MKCAYQNGAGQLCIQELDLQSLLLKAHENAQQSDFCLSPVAGIDCCRWRNYVPITAAQSAWSVADGLQDTHCVMSSSMTCAPPFTASSGGIPACIFLNVAHWFGFLVHRLFIGLLSHHRLKASTSGFPRAIRYGSYALRSGSPADNSVWIDDSDSDSEAAMVIAAALLQHALSQNLRSGAMMCDYHSQRSILARYVTYRNTARRGP